MHKEYSLYFESQIDCPETSAEMIFCLTMLDVTHQQETEFDVLNLYSGKWPTTTSFNDLPAVQMTTDASHDATLQPKSNYSIELIGRLVTSYEECFSQTNHGHLVAMCTHPLFTGSGFEELKIMREEEGDGDELIKK